MLNNENLKKNFRFSVKRPIQNIVFLTTQEGQNKQCQNKHFINHIMTDNNNKKILSKFKSFNNQLLECTFGEFSNCGPLNVYLLNIH